MNVLTSGLGQHQIATPIVTQLLMGPYNPAQVIVPLHTGGETNCCDNIFLLTYNSEKELGILPKPSPKLYLFSRLLPRMLGPPNLTQHDNKLSSGKLNFGLGSSSCYPNTKKDWARLRQILLSTKFRPEPELEYIYIYISETLYIFGSLYLSLNPSSWPFSVGKSLPNELL